MPTGDVSGNPSIGTTAIGNCALRESSAMEVVVKIFVICSLGRFVVRGDLDLVTSPTSVEAVDATMITSERLGGKSFKRSMNWYGEFRSMPKGGQGSGSF